MSDGGVAVLAAAAGVGPVPGLGAVHAVNRGSGAARDVTVGGGAAGRVVVHRGVVLGRGAVGGNGVLLGVCGGGAVGGELGGVVLCGVRLRGLVHHGGDGLRVDGHELARGSLQDGLVVLAVHLVQGAEQPEARHHLCAGAHAGLLGLHLGLGLLLSPHGQPQQQHHGQEHDGKEPGTPAAGGCLLGLCEDGHGESDLSRDEGLGCTDPGTHRCRPGPHTNSTQLRGWIWSPAGCISR